MTGGLCIRGTRMTSIFTTVPRSDRATVIARGLLERPVGHTGNHPPSANTISVTILELPDQFSVSGDYDHTIVLRRQHPAVRRDLHGPDTALAFNRPDRDAAGEDSFQRRGLSDQ